MPNVNPEVASMIDRFVAFKPQYQQLMNYLIARESVPDQQVKRLPADRNAQYSPRSNEITYAPTTVADINAFPNTAVHELTHAAREAMNDQTRFRRWTGQSDQMVDALRKLTAPSKLQYPAREGVTQKQLEYRNSPDEFSAFGMGNMAGPNTGEPIFSGPAHMDATAATEFEILLDLAMREAQKAKK
jgi:hypothetical protein